MAHDQLIAVTGLLRSGTSCVTGCLERLGFSLGNGMRVLKEPGEYNAKGHFELMLVLAINDALLREAGSGHSLRLPPQDRIDAVGRQSERYFTFFTSKFDGQVFKDPRLCLTYAAWERFCPTLRNVVYCLRHPLGSATSMAHRYRIPLEQALDLWYEYTARFIRSPKVSRVSIVDYDHLCRDPIFELSRLMADLGQPLPDSEIRDRLGDFLNPELNHRPLDPAAAPPLPPAIQALYVEIKTLRRHRSPRSMPVQ